jgi:hypothetical protein
MHDMIGTTGMVQGWIAMWHSAVVWVIPAFVVSVAATGLLETLASAGQARWRHPAKPPSATRKVGVVSEVSVALTRNVFTDETVSGSIAAHGAD